MDGRHEILIVEDSITQAMTLERLLQKHFARVSRCRNGHEALSYLSQGRPALVISDVVMPEMDGYQLCAEIKRTPAVAAIPVILLTSMVNSVEVVRSLECGADNFIFKPYDDAHMLSTIAQTLDHTPVSNESRDPIDIMFAGQKFSIGAGRRNILNLLLTTYQSMVDKNLELENSRKEVRNLAQHLEELVTKQSLELQKSLSRTEADAA